MSEKVVLITGATGGIGKATALGLAQRGLHLVVVGRDQGRGDAAVADIVRQSRNDSVRLLVADLATQSGVRNLAARFLAEYARLDVLINNVGGLYSKRWVTQDDFEASWAINHLSPFLLTQLLLPILRASAPARIVNVNSEAHRFAGAINFDDLQSRQWRRGFAAYSHAKLANLLCTYTLAERLVRDQVSVNALHPGIVDTDLVKRFVREKFYIWNDNVTARLSVVIRKIAGLVYRFDDPESAAEACIHLALAPELEGVTGKYFNKDKTMIASSPASCDKAAAARLWDISMQQTGWSEAR